MAQTVKEFACNAGLLGSILGQEDPPEKGMATQSSSLAWEIPWTEEPCGYSPWGRKRVRHDLGTKATQNFPRRFLSHRSLRTPNCLSIANFLDNF